MHIRGDDKVEIMSNELVWKAKEFSKEKHKGQKRKYTGEDYYYHTKDVAHRVWASGGSVEAVCAAYLHDTIEDTGTSYSELVEAFGEKIAGMVVSLSDVSVPEDGNRATRKKIDREAYIGASDEVKTVKLADMLSNTSSITKHDKNFAVIYMKEKELLLPYLKGGSVDLFRSCEEVIRKWKEGKPDE